MGERLPRVCECGGKIVYARTSGRLFSYCERCTTQHPRDTGDDEITAPSEGKAE